MYVAIQWYGLIRGFRFERTRQLFYERIIKQLENQGYEVHIFCHTYDIEYDDIIKNLNEDKFNMKKVVVDSDKKIQNYLENEYKLEEKYNFLQNWRICTHKGTKSFDVGVDHHVSETYHIYGWFKFIYSMKQVNKIRNIYQKENNINYKWVILTSPQMEPQRSIDDLTKLDNKFMYSPNYSSFGGFYTSFFFGNENHIDYIAELWDYMIEKKFKNDNNKNYTYFKNELINSEPIFKKYVDSKYTMKSILSIRFHRIRYNGSIIDH